MNTNSNEKMRLAIQSLDWSANALGRSDAWPLRLQYALDICLGSNLPMAICWGDERTLLYNDAWSLLPDFNNPWALGRPANQVWEQQWSNIEPVFQSVIETGATIHITEQLFTLPSDNDSDELYLDYTVQSLSSGQGRMGILVIAEPSLAKVNQRNEEFLTTLVHELRNPLATLAAAAQLLSKAVDKPAIVAASREALIRQVNYLAQLLDDSLDASRLMRGGLQLRNERFAIADIVAEAIKDSQALIESKKLRLVVEKPIEPLYINGDKTYLVKVFSRLLANATKHTEPEGLIQLQIKSNNSIVEITVKDSGVGIAAEVIEHIFEKRSQKKSSRPYGSGLGIDLYMVYKLLKLHGGQITAQSKGIGTGSEFVVQLPFASIVDQQVLRTSNDGDDATDT